MLYSAAVPRAVATSYDCTACCDARSRSQLLATRMLQPPNDPRALQTGAAQLHTCVHGLAKRPPASGAPALLNGPRAQNTLPPRGSPRAAPPEERRRAARGQRMRRTTAWSQQPRAAHACSLARSHARTLARPAHAGVRCGGGACHSQRRRRRGGGEGWRTSMAPHACSACAFSSLPPYRASAAERARAAASRPPPPSPQAPCPAFASLPENRSGFVGRKEKNVCHPNR